jgi:hypothetical protein
LRAKLADEKAEMPRLREFLLAFVMFIRAAFGASPDVLADFGLDPTKARKPLTVEQMAAAAAKRAATRAARGIIGRRKRARVKGDVQGVVVTPVKAPSEQAAQPAQQASNGSNGGNATK